MEITPSKTASPSSIEGLKHFLETNHIHFPRFSHEGHAPVNVNEVADSQLTLGAKIADKVAAGVGSWPFIIIQSIILAAWITLNCIAGIAHWDSYPFILLNLALSFQAAYSAPFVMMSQNRQAAKDRITAENDYKTDVKGEQELCHVLEHLDHQDELTLQIVQRLELQNQRIDQQEQLILALVQKIDSQQQAMKQQHLEILGKFNAPQQNGATQS